MKNFFNLYDHGPYRVAFPEMIHADQELHLFAPFVPKRLKNLLFPSVYFTYTSILLVWKARVTVHI